MAKISVIIPCYNAGAWIGRCLRSIENQTFGMENLEVICVDDASTDDTMKVLREWEQRYPEQIMVVACEENGRQGTARNIGLQYASGEWIAFVDADDWLEPEYFTLLYGIAESGDYEVVSCGHVRDADKELRFLTKEEKQATGAANGGHAFCIRSHSERAALIHDQPMKLLAWGKLLCRTFLEEQNLYFPERLAYEDIFWGELLYLQVSRFYVLEAKLYHYFVNEDSTVLKKDAWYHADMLTVQALLHQEWLRRGALDQYPEELEYEYIYTGALAFLKILALRFENPPYALFRLLQAYHTEHFPNAVMNRYLAQSPEMHRLLIGALGMNITQAQFSELMEQVRSIGI